MTPRASDVYFKLLDSKMSSLEKTASASVSILARLNARAARVGVNSLGAGAGLAEIAAHRRAIEAAEKAASGGGGLLNWLRTREPFMDWNKIRDLGMIKKPVPAPEVEKVVQPASSGIGKALLGFGLGGGLIGTGAYQYARQQAEEEATRNKLISFGGGVATGLAAPSILSGVNKFVKNQGLLKLDPNQGDEGYSYLSGYPSGTLSLYGGQY